MVESVLVLSVSYVILCVFLVWCKFHIKFMAWSVTLRLWWASVFCLELRYGLDQQKLRNIWLGIGMAIYPRFRSLGPAICQN